MPCTSRSLRNSAGHTLVKPPCSCVRHLQTFRPSVWSTRGGTVEALCGVRLAARNKGALIRRLSTTKEGEQRNADLADDVDAEQFPFQLPKRPKFQPFVGESDAKQLLEGFRHELQTPEGGLLIQPLAEGHIPQASELLATSFADAVGYMPMYRALLKQEVRTYLHSHLNLAPKAIILVAMLSGPQVEEEDSVISKPTATPDWNSKGISSSAAPPQEETSNGSDTARNEEAEEIANPLQSGPSFPAQLLQSLSVTDDVREETEGQPLVKEDADGREHDPAAEPSASANSASSYSSFSESKARAFREGRLDGGASEVVDSRESVSDVGDEEAGSQTTAAETGRAAEQTSASRLESASETGENLQRANGKLVGTVELSFSQSTRTPSITLNPPQNCAYLCNMAVHEDFQRRGYGMRLLAAAEDVVRLAGFRRIHLHVRLRDDPARGLYSKAGFELEKEDCMLVSLWDHRRQLLSKFLPQHKPATQIEPSDDTEPFVTEY